MVSAFINIDRNFDMEIEIENTWLLVLDSIENSLKCYIKSKVMDSQKNNRFY
jgi:hypothetical protein